MDPSPSLIDGAFWISVGDARDTFKKSFESQGYLFLQEKGAGCSPKHRQRRALVILRGVSGS